MAEEKSQKKEGSEDFQLKDWLEITGTYLKKVGQELKLKGIEFIKKVFKED